MVHEPTFYADFKSPFPNCRKWDDLGFSEPTVYFFSENRKNILMDIPGHVRYQKERYMNQVKILKCVGFSCYWT